MLVRELLEPSSGLGLRLVAGAAGLDHVVTLSRVQRPGLALTGYTEYIRYGRVQILGASELGYLRKLSAARGTSQVEASVSRNPRLVWRDRAVPT